jgi:hypothetical protein
MRDHSRRPRRVGSARSLAALAAVTLGALGTSAVRAESQVTRLATPSAESFAMALAPSVSVNVTSGSTQSLPNLVDNAANNFHTPVGVHVSWSDIRIPALLCVAAYFTNPGQALNAGGGATIPSSLIKGSIDSGGGFGTYQSFTQNGCGSGVGSNGGSLRVNSLVITRDGTANGQIRLQIDLRGQPVLPPGIYSGTLNIRAMVQ